MLHPLLLHPLILRPLILRSGPSWVCVSKDEGSLASTSQPAGTLVLRDAMRSRIAPQDEGARPDPLHPTPVIPAAAQRRAGTQESPHCAGHREEASTTVRPPLGPG
jgi:hypothetical protein